MILQLERVECLGVSDRTNSVAQSGYVAAGLSGSTR